MTILSLDSFQKLFEPNIRALLNWELLKQNDASIETMVIDSHDDLASLFTVWHVDADRKPASWDSPHAYPLRVQEASAPAYKWNEHRKHLISNFQNHYLSSAEPVNLMLPVYKVDAGFVLLDSTHRAVAVHQAELDFSAMLVILNGPQEESILPDLRWHANNIPKDPS
jgi:hypothetical protein